MTAGAVFAAILGGLLALYWCGPWPDERLADLCGATMSFAGISVGFLATAKSILLSSGASAGVRQLRESGRYALFADALSWAMRSSLGLVAASMFGLAAPYDWQQAVVSVWAVMTALAGASIYFATERLALVFGNSAVDVPRAKRDAAAEMHDLLATDEEAAPANSSTPSHSRPKRPEPTKTAPPASEPPPKAPKRRTPKNGD